MDIIKEKKGEENEVQSEFVFDVMAAACSLVLENCKLGDLDAPIPRKIFRN